MKKYYVISGINKKFDVLHEVKKFIDNYALLGRLTLLDGKYIYRYISNGAEDIEDESYVRVIRTYIVRRTLRYRLERVSSFWLD